MKVWLVTKKIRSANFSGKQFYLLSTSMKLAPEPCSPTNLISNYRLNSTFLSLCVVNRDLTCCALIYRTLIHCRASTTYHLNIERREDTTHNFSFKRFFKLLFIFDLCLTCTSLLNRGYECNRAIIHLIPSVGKWCVPTLWGDIFKKHKCLQFYIKLRWWWYKKKSLKTFLSEVLLIK